MIHHEWHVTVAPCNYQQWRNFCYTQDIKPLWIELSNGTTQAMCAAKTDPSEAIAKSGYTIIRRKHEASEPSGHEYTHYWECHVKIDGPFDYNYRMASRDLYRENRWYVTQRSSGAFDPSPFVKQLQTRYGSGVVGFEYEVCLLDSNAGLDKGWACMIDSRCMRCEGTGIIQVNYDYTGQLLATGPYWQRCWECKDAR